MLQGLRAGGGKGIAGGCGDKGIQAVPTHLPGFLHLQGTLWMGAGCHKLSSHVQGGDVWAGDGAVPFWAPWLLLVPNRWGLGCKGTHV